MVTGIFRRNTLEISDSLRKHVFSSYNEFKILQTCFNLYFDAETRVPTYPVLSGVKDRVEILTMEYGIELLKILTYNLDIVNTRRRLSKLAWSCSSMKNMYQNAPSNDLTGPFWYTAKTRYF